MKDIRKSFPDKATFKTGLKKRWELAKHGGREGQSAPRRRPSEARGRGETEEDTGQEHRAEAREMGALGHPGALKSWHGGV